VAEDWEAWLRVMFRVSQRALSQAILQQGQPGQDFFQGFQAGKLGQAQEEHLERRSGQG